MACRVVYKKSLHRDLKKLPKAEAAHILERIESELSGSPEGHPVLKGRFAGLRKYRVGDYRVIYALLEGEVLVLRIAHRKHVYRGET